MVNKTATLNGRPLILCNVNIGQYLHSDKYYLFLEKSSLVVFNKFYTQEIKFIKSKD